MNKNTQMGYYHNETKHSQLQYAKSLGYMDWATQPNPHRSYADTQLKQSTYSTKAKTFFCTFTSTS